METNTADDRAGALRFVEAAARDRVARYRDQANQFRELAEMEAIGRLRDQLLHLAGEYDRLAASLSADRDGRSALTPLPKQVTEGSTPPRATKLRTWHNR